MQALTRIPCLANVDLKALRAASSLWRVVDVPRGQVLWREGDLSDGLGIVMEGWFEARCDGWPVGTVNMNQIIGELSAFHDYARRTATVKATRDSRVLRISIASLRMMRKLGSPIYDALLAESLLNAARRVRDTDLTFARKATGTLDRPVRDTRRGYQRLLAKACLPPDDLPTPTNLLRQLPGLETLACAGEWTLKRLGPGQCAFMEGDRTREAWLIARGDVEVLRMTGARHAMLLTEAGPGQMVGINAAIDPAPRTATARARSEVWAWVSTLDRPSVLLREALLFALTSQVIVANTGLAATQADALDSARNQPRRKAQAPRRQPQYGLDVDALDAALQAAVDDLSAA